MSQLVIPRIAAQTLMQFLNPVWDLRQVHLYQNNLAPGPGTVLADLVEATFAGYGAAALTFLTLVQDLDAKVFAMFERTHPFSGVSVITPQPIFGMYFTDPGNTILRAVVRFETPYTFQDNNGPMETDVAYSIQQEFVPPEPVQRLNGGLAFAVGQITPGGTATVHSSP